ncbi:hypothetical protein [Paenibacillus nasutitermitis]|uniref:Uncharacterized protein n=1 Tax=Paenibacillus nasutitermitis TaxID=1652958 RepID=A0A916ZE18_9BACL|nr:hypothetical protein [Paenibacillus nasutitermitis]GGD90210.1 hypothetical protein GCM10010911_56080 [Paenibacillus nasutitermitis]
MTAQTKHQTFELPGGERSRMIFQYKDDVQGYGYTLQNETGGQWEAMSAQFQPLIRGSRFDLYPDEIRQISALELAVSGTKRDQDTLLYTWSGTITADRESGWLQVDLALMGEGTMLINSNVAEPEITVGLGDLPPYERGDHVWYKTNIDNPTKWNDEAGGNDFPACYYYDSYKKFGVMLFFNMTKMGWMAEAGIPRFLHYRCGMRRNYSHEKGNLVVGLIGDAPLAVEFPLQHSRFSYALRCLAMDEPPTERSAVVDLVEACLHFVPREASLPPGATSWRDFGIRCAEDLLDEDACWNGNGSYNMLIPYVNGVSPAWEESFQAKGLTVDFRNQPGMDAALMMIHPLTEISRSAPSPVYEELRRKVWEFIRHAGDEFLENRPRVWGTWQYIFLLEEWWRAAWFEEDGETSARIEAAVEAVVIPLAQRSAYLFPLSFRAPELKKHGNGDNLPVAGAYSYFMLLLYRAKGEKRYLEEAERSLRVLLHLPVNDLHQESFLLSMAIQAADGLFKETGDIAYEEAYRYLLAQNLRMMYWFNDPGFTDYKLWGMFQACTPMLYPAFFENLECAARIASTLKDRSPSDGLIRALNQARMNNFYCFPKCLPEKFRLSELDYIPLENLGTLEDDKTGYAGQEIYGAGQTFRAALLWDQWASCSDERLYMMNLDGYALNRRSAAPAVRTIMIAHLEDAVGEYAIELHEDYREAVVIRGGETVVMKPAKQEAGNAVVQLKMKQRESLLLQLVL